jgi:hypothetical protein
LFKGGFSLINLFGIVLDILEEFLSIKKCFLLESSLIISHIPVSLYTIGISLSITDAAQVFQLFSAGEMPPTL